MATRRRNPSAPQNVWRARQIILEPELVRRLGEWHGGQGSKVYALASWGQNHLVSLSMIDAAEAELERHYATMRKSKSKTQLRHVLNGLSDHRIFWREHSAKEAGMEDPIEGYDERDYGLSPSEEAEINVRSG